MEGGFGQVLFEHTKEQEDFVVTDIASDPRYIAIIEQMQIDIYTKPEAQMREWQFNYTLVHNTTNGTMEAHNRTFRFKA